MSAVPAITAKSRLSAKECLESWSAIYAATLQIRKQWSSVWALPILDQASDLIVQNAPGPGTLLDVGAASSSTIKETLAREMPAIRYFSFDIDRRTSQDFYSWTEIAQTFDTVVSLEVIEHLSVAAGLELCEKAYEHLKPGAVFVVGTPNIFNPTRYLQDPTHVTPWCYDRLAGALLALGFDICGIFRQRGELRQGTFKARVMAFVAAKMRPYLGLDSAHSIYVVARRPAVETKAR